MNTNKSFRFGFTLNELLVVIAIIGLLAGIVIANVNPARERAKNGKISADIGQYLVALRLAKEKDGGYPNPGSGNTNWYCLGENSTCDGWSAGGSDFSPNTAINTSLKSVMTELPVGKDKIGSYTGYAYRCSNYNNGSCTSFNLGWFLYGSGQDCSPGSPNSSFSGSDITYCRYDR